MKNISLLIILFFLMMSCKAQDVAIKRVDREHFIEDTKPKLIVAIIIDQMRYDYLTRFYKRYGEGGFKRMVDEGYNCKNHHYNYIPTKTGPGHASIFTGTTPKYHGIIGNDWFDKKLKRKVNCVEDNSVNPLGTSSDDGKKSPQLMMSTTFADENRLFTQMRGKTIGISIKHRGAILSAGHTANAAYWLDYDHDGNGNWISSTFYMDSLPQWVKDFNASDITESYFRVWNPLYDINTYTESGSDLNNFERIYKDKETATFPYDLNDLKTNNGGFKIIAESPYGNNLITDFALTAIDNEELGKDAITDVLTISYSSTDKVGHDFGPNSIEVEDTYLRLDLELERLLNGLDDKVGDGEYTVFLTADHAAPNVPTYLKSRKIPSGLFDNSTMIDEMNNYLQSKYDVSNILLSRINNQLYFDYQKLDEHQLNLQVLKKEVSKKLLEYDLIDKVYTTSELNHFIGPEGYMETLLENGHNQKRSGDVLFVFSPAVFKDTPWNRTGTDHHSGYSYDTHVPLLFFGKGISQGETFKRTEVIDIAPTMSALLNISFPNACTGNPLEFVLE